MSKLQKWAKNRKQLFCSLKIHVNKGTLKTKPSQTHALVSSFWNFLKRFPDLCGNSEIRSDIRADFARNVQRQREADQSELDLSLWPRLLRPLLPIRIFWLFVSIRSSFCQKLNTVDHLKILITSDQISKRCQSKGFLRYRFQREKLSAYFRWCVVAELSQSIFQGQNGTATCLYSAGKFWFTGHVWTAETDISSIWLGYSK